MYTRTDRYVFDKVSFKLLVNRVITRMAWLIRLNYFWFENPNLIFVSLSFLLEVYDANVMIVSYL